MHGTHRARTEKRHGKHGPALSAAILIVLSSWTAPAFAERETRTAKAVVACATWAAWREFGQASLSARGARMGELCPVRLRAGTKVVVVEEDAGAGASEIRHGGKRWIVDEQALR